MTFTSFLLIILGWLLGILSHTIVQRIQNYYKKDEVKRGILTELEEYKYRTAISTYLLEQDFGTYDKALVQWTYDNIKDYKVGYYKDSLVKELEERLKLSDKEIAKIGIKEKEEGGGRSLKKDDLPYLNSNISYLPLFDVDFQNKVFSIRSHNSLLNSEIEHAIFCYKMTFDSSLNEKNHKTISRNLENSYRNIARYSRTQVERINGLLMQKGGRKAGR